VAERFADAGEHEDAIAATVAAAQVALVNHPGVFSSERLESVLRRIAADELDPVPTRERPDSPRRVLHVASETYGVGGHTRAILRWIARDGERVHDVVTTDQRTPMPAPLVTLAEASGGRHVALDPSASYLDRARALRDLAAQADVVVLYPHYRDPVPVLAFSGPGDRPPAIFFNHADHMFWLGYSVADVLQCLRPLPAHELRGVPSERIVMTPLAVDGPDGHSGAAAPADLRAGARPDLLRQLGWPEDTVLALTVGNAIKFMGPSGTTLPELVEPALAELPSLRVLAIGALGAPGFAELSARMGGRVAVVDRMAGLGPVYAAADVYLESRPGGGGTTTAEAASHGLPCLSYAPSDLEAEVLATAPMYGNHIARTHEEYRGTLRELARDPSERAAMGERARAAVSAADAAWEEGVERVYAEALRLGPVAPEELRCPAEDGHPMHLLVEWFQELHAAMFPTDAAEPAVVALELAASGPALRSLFSTLAGPDARPALARRYPAAFAAPPSDPDTLRDVIAEFRRLALVGAAERHVIALRPQDADSAVPVLEEALASGPDVDVELVLDEDPLGARPEWALDVPLAAPVA
jgi:hypothetical protein